MIGFQHQQQQQQQQSQAPQPRQAAALSSQIKNSNCDTRTSAPRDHTHHQHQLPQLSQHCQNMSLAGTPPARPVSSASSSGSSSSPSPTHNPMDQNHNHNHNHNNNNNNTRGQPHKTSTRRVSSPSYHSAASSPGSTSIASPVSSSSSSGISSAASSSSSSSCQSSSMLTSPQPATGGGRMSGAPSQSPHETIVSCTTASVSHGHYHSHHELSSPPPPPPPPRPPSSSLGSDSQQQQTHKQTGNGPQRTLAPGSGLNQTNLLDHFPELEGNNGLRLSWFHEANNRQTLDHALAGSKHIIAGDISLAEMSRYPVPIMARPPLGVSDLTLETWLTDVIRSRKGIKLTFTSTRTVEPAFRVLARHAQNLKGPLILSANILLRPSATTTTTTTTINAKLQTANNKQQEQQPVDAWTFLMLCRTRFPRSIISIGWCPGPGEQHASPDLCIQPADSSTSTGSSTTTSGPDSMYELDMMTMDAAPSVGVGHHFSQPLMHLSSAPSSQQHQQRLSSLNVVQQLAAVAAAAAANNQHQHHFILSSNGSLNSSSGNSSGSPSPTSPLSHLMRHHHNHHSHSHQQQRHSSRQVAVAGWPAMAAAAMVAANNLRQRCHLGADDDEEEEEEQEGQGEGEDEHDEDQDVDDDDQLPLNLNINEADPQHATAQGALNDLAQKIHTLQQQSSNLSTLTSSFAKVRSYPHCQSHNQANNQNKWDHISKKAALAHRLNADSPSPVSTSPQQQQSHNNFNNNLRPHHPTTGGNLLCVKPTHPLHNNNNNNNHSNHHHHHHHHHSLANLALATQGHSSSLAINSLSRHTPIFGQTTIKRLQDQTVAAREQGGLGYTRDMIDKMASLVKEYNLTQAITFPIEARLMLRNNSIAELQRLLNQVGPHSTLTIVAQQEDLISVDQLLLIRKHFSSQQLLFDLPEELAISLRRELDR